MLVLGCSLSGGSALRTGTGDMCNNSEYLADGNVWRRAGLRAQSQACVSLPLTATANPAGLGISNLQLKEHRLPHQPP